MERIYIEEQQVSINLEDHEDLVSDSESTSPSSNFDKFVILKRSNGMRRVENGDSEYEIVKKGFLDGMGTFGKDTDIEAIHRCSYGGVMSQARLETFQIYSEAVAKKRGGNANIKYAWYGSSMDEICDILSHGFSRISKRSSYGHGVCLSPAKLSLDRALSTAADENGLRHLLLCRVILGNMETIFEGSKQFKPTSKEFDSGVDNVLSPRRYIIWSTHMNSYILPTYVISFKAPSIDSLKASKPNSPYMRFPTLVSMLGDYLNSSHMASIARYYRDYKENKIRRKELIQKLRGIVGDELLTAVIKSYSNR